MQIKSFVKSESAAVTVDWVVLTAGIAGLGLAVASVVSGGVESLSGDVATTLDEQEIATSFGTQGGGGSSLSWTPHYDADTVAEFRAEAAAMTDEELISSIAWGSQAKDHPGDGGVGAEDAWHDMYWIGREEAESRNLEVPVQYL